jgi:hypothetical protein
MTCARFQNARNRSDARSGVPRMGRTIAWLLSILVLGLTGTLGVYNGITEWPDAHTPLQKSVTGGVLLYGVLGLAGIVGLALRRRWSFPVVIAWAVVVTYVPAAAVMAYAPDGTIGAALTAGAGAALIAAGVAWVAHVATRKAPAA